LHIQEFLQPDNSHIFAIRKKVIYRSAGPFQLSGWRRYAERGMPKNLTFHSDRGGQYISDAFSKLLQQFGVKQSFSATARPHDNAVAEAFFATFKKEEAYRREYTSERHFRQSVDEYICFYNEVRPHATLKYKTPQAFEAAYTNDYIEKTCSNSGGG